MNAEQTNYNLHEVENGVPVKMWTRGVPVEDEAQEQLENVARLPFVLQARRGDARRALRHRRDRRLGDPDAKARSSRRRSASTSAAA